MSKLSIALLAEAELELLKIKVTLEAEAKEYGAEWLGSGKTVLREGGRFASNSSSTLQTPGLSSKSNFDDIFGAPEDRLSCDSSFDKVFKPRVTSAYCNAEKLSEDLPKATTEEALAKRVAYMDYKELTNPDTHDLSVKVVQRVLSDRDIEIEGQIDDPSSGFKAWKFNSKAGDRPMLVATGTETKGLADIRADLMGNVGYDQYELNAKKIGDYLEEEAAKGNKVEVSGHSLGGALTQMIVASHPDKISKAITFNAAGVPETVNAEYEENVAKTGSRPEITHHIAEGDAVSLAGERFLDGNIKISGGYGNAMDAHLAMVDGHQEKSISRAELESPNYEVKYLGRTMTRQDEHKYRAAVQPVLNKIFRS